MTPDEEAKALLQPILDVFGGADGGVAFYKLRFEMLPVFLELHSSKTVDIIRSMSDLCERLLESK